MISFSVLLGSTIMFIFILFLGVPIPICICLFSVCFLPFIGKGVPIVLMAQRIISTFDKSALFAVFFFVALGNLLSAGNLSEVIINFINSIFGRMKGGLAVITIFASTLFGALTGSVTSTIAAIGGTTIPEMKKRNYSGPFAAAVAAASGINGSMIPPSINGLTYAVVNNLSIVAVFISTLIPGIIYAILLSVMAVFISKKRNYKGDKTSFSLPEIGKLSIKALPALVIPFGLIVLIYGGIATPTESGAVATALAIFLGAVIYKGLTKDKFKKTLIQTSITTGIIMFLISSSFVLSYIFSMSGVTSKISNMLLHISNNPNILIFIINIILLALGTILDAQAIIIIFSPIVSSVLVPLGINPLHLAGVFVFACLIGLIIPPVATGLSVACTTSGENIEDVTKELLPFLGVAIFVLFLISYIPEIVLFLPRLLGLA